MRILYVSYMHPKVAPGGAQQVAYELFKASLAKGHEAFLVSALEINHEAEYGKPGAPIVPLHGEDRQYLYFPQNYDFLHLSVSDWRSLKFFSELVVRLAPDVVHFHHYHRVGVESIRAARNAAPKATICLTFHEMMAICMADGQMLKKPSRDLCVAATPVECNQCFPDLRPEFVTLRAARLKAALEECDHFIFPSEFLAERYVDWGLPSAKCIVIHNGQANPAPTFDRKQHSSFVNRFGFFGQFIDNKGIDVILEALIILSKSRRVPASGIIVEVNGGNQHYATSDYIEKIKSQLREIERLAVGPIEINQRGKYTRDELANRMRVVDWVIVPSTWWEVFGLVISEAWMFGRPVIASAIGGIPERVIDGANGVTFPARDASALANVMVSLIGNEDNWKRLNTSISQPSNDLDMFNSHFDLWSERLT